MTIDRVPVTGVSELVLEVLDLEAALAFYRDVLGFPVVDPGREDRAWLMAGTGTRIGLWKPQVGLANGRGGVHVHFAMHLAEDDLEPTLVRLREHGHEPEVIEFEGRGRAAYVMDPDGNCVELWTWDVARHLGT